MSYRSGFATDANASAVVASSGTRAQAVRAAGGVSPSGASAAVPKSMTSATRFRPSRAAVSPQIAGKSAAPRGWTASDESRLTANRKPCTVPSVGRAVDGPCVAYAQAEPSRSQKDQ
ncbi:hypothetical protein CVT30_32255 [Streptomyces sp. AMCC400023]|nr:hypothetical protein [Streptomyces sp. AMCC400023]UJV43887.1 hypothetical protein CVT30_32255 [Streptomyces sp. AMCC400023]